MNEQTILRAVCAFHKIESAALLERTNVMQIVWLRHALIYLLRTHTNLSLMQIGKFVGGRDQATIKNAVERVAVRIIDDDDYADHIQNLTRFAQEFAVEASPEPALALARRMIGTESTPRDAVARAGLCLLTTAAILGNLDLSDAEARQAALSVLGSLPDVV